MVLEGIVKYLTATIILLFSLALGWLVSAKYLEPVILKAFNPETHEKYLDIWFTVFVLIELAILSGYTLYIYRVYMSNKHLTKSSSGRS
ncbi:hypothetical protein V757_01815 [Pelistega indica]|jgi:hypothetical protein|uniref:Uncharacterized protein n=1 Tax=Pelistega indica TaxID=1414851 RepID=V8G8V0_9BURK|nr:hypothetical protein V757_01815 [Pelistega indica]